MKTIGVVTVARSDWGPLRAVLLEAQTRPALRCRLYVAGSHLSAAHGMTITDIDTEQWPVAVRIETVCSDTPRGIATSMAAALSGFGAAYDGLRPDALLLLGDRFETFCAAAAALPFRIPVFHLHGGEATEGLYDETFRHAITKMAHVHLASSVWAADRLRALGEEGWRIRVVGAPGLDGIDAFKPIPRAEADFLPGAGKFLLVIQHPVTLDGTPQRGMLAVANAIRQIGLPVLWIGPGYDSGWSFMEATAGLLRLDDTSPQCRYAPHLPRPQFWTAMAYAEAMVGNSSAGIIEAASFGLPVVNVGDRQQGRLRPANVVQADPNAEMIEWAIRRALKLDKAWLKQNVYNPYGDGRASPQICDALEQTPLDERLLKKRLAV